jgi:hypothetical protein
LFWITYRGQSVHGLNLAVPEDAKELIKVDVVLERETSV